METWASKRELRLGSLKLPTPLVIPSFSSRAKPPIPLKEFLDEILFSVVGPVLVSAYDIFHEPDISGFDFRREILKATPSFVLMDSGGYEANWNRKARQAKLIAARDARGWSRRHHNHVIANWPVDVPLVVATFDTPERLPGSFEKQIEAAVSLAGRHPQFSVELLLKPPKPGRQRYLIASDIVPLARKLGQFAMIGVTEDEIGESMVERLAFLVELRLALDEARLATPIHVFGGLDPLMTPLYFWAGADVFDGLSWIRYAYEDGKSLYAKSFVTTEYPDQPVWDAYWNLRRRNIRILTDLQISMQQFLSTKDPKVFGSVGEKLRSTWDRCRTNYIRNDRP